MKKQVNGSVYGKYSLGAGSILLDKDRVWSKISDPGVIKSYKRSIKSDLAKAGISLDKLKDWVVMDVGTGRQAIAFQRLGAKLVHHYDISPENVRNMENFIEGNSLKNVMTTECVDLVKRKFPEGKFDFIYLNGIVQHFSQVGTGLRNCSQALKQGGYLWLYFYRSGTFLMFTLYLIRDLISNFSEIKEYFVNSILLYSDTVQPNFIVSNIMDDFFVPHFNLYTTRSYISLLNKCGFEIVSSSKLDCAERDVEHEFAHSSVVVTCKKTRSTDLSKVEAEKLLPQKSVDQLNPENYSSKEIIKTISCYADLKKALLNKKIPRSVIMCIAFRLYRFIQSTNQNLDSKCYSDHKQLQLILSNTIKLLKEEF